MNIFTTLGDGIESVRQGDRAVPALGANDIQVRTTAASLNYRDLLVIKGVAHWKPSVPRIPISDGVGHVVAVGDSVTRFKVGDRVAGIFLPTWIDGELTTAKNQAGRGGATLDGVLAEQVVFDEQTAVEVPASLSDLEASALPVAALTAWHALVRRSKVRAGDTVLIHGTGGVSLFATQFAHALGAKPIVTSSSDAKLQKARSLGAWSTINYRERPDWDSIALELTGGNGVDHVIETVGGENLNRSLAAVRVSGTISFIGLIAGLSAPIDTYKFVMRNVQLHGIETGSRDMFEEMNRFIDAHGIKPVIDQAFELNDLTAALRRLESGAHFGKIVLRLQAQ